MSVRVEHGDSRDVLKTLADCSVDAVVTDPPYALVSIQKRFGKPGSAEAKDRDGLYKRASAGFMGQQWDTGEVAFDPAFWAEVLRVLKPGGHLLAFGGTRTYHRLACAIEDAGFEIRDQIGWLYGSGFPKSLDVSKQIDKRRDWRGLEAFQKLVRKARTSIGISQSEAARRAGIIGPQESLGGGGFMWFETGKRIPTAAQYARLKEALALGDECDAAFQAAEREVIGRYGEQSAPGGFGDHRFSFNSRDITAPATDAARRWEGWGTALKPAWEPICLARKPLIGTVAENVLAYGTGALNIDGCRVGDEGGTAKGSKPEGSGNGIYGAGLHGACEITALNKGRWPANIIHDGSDEVVAAFPEAPGQQGVVTGNEPSSPFANVYGDMPNRAGRADPRADAGSAARFFYSAKADAADRLGSKHPTVKPVDLMAYLCRLVTPPGGTVLDPFAGSGTTGMACMREGFNAILIEREAQFVADIKRRIAHVSGLDAPLFAEVAQ